MSRPPTRATPPSWRAPRRPRPAASNAWWPLALTAPSAKWQRPWPSPACPWPSFPPAPDPFRAALLQLQEAGEEAWIWAPGDADNAGEHAAVVLDVLEGPPDNVAQRIIAMHPVGVNSTGLRAGAVEGVLIAAVELLDQLGASRTFENLMPAARRMADELLARGELSKQGQAGLDDWLERLRTLRRQFGDNIGPGLRISEALARGAAVMIELSAYRDPTRTGPLASFFVVFAMWVVASQGDFDLLLDEAGATDPTLYAKIFQATRAAGVRITAGGQSPAQFDDTIREMCSTVLFCGVAIAAPEAADWASKVTKKTSSQLTSRCCSRSPGASGWRFGAESAACARSRVSCCTTAVWTR